MIFYPKNLQTKIFYIAAPLLLISSLSFVFIVYFQSIQRIKDSVGYQFESVLSYIRTRIDTQRLQSVMEQIKKNPLNESNRSHVLLMEEYQDIHKQLEDIRLTSGVKYIYIMFINDGKIYYAIDSYPSYSEEFVLPGTLDENDSAGLHYSFSREKAYAGELVNTPHGATFSSYEPILDANGKLIAVIAAVFDGTQTYRDLVRGRYYLAGFVLIMLLVSLLISYLISIAIMRPVKALMRSSEAVSKGDLTVRIQKEDKSNDEIGQVAASFQNMVYNLTNLISSINRVSHQITTTSSDLDKNIERSTGESSNILINISESNQSAEGIHNGATESARAMTEMTKGMQQIARASAGITAGANQTSDMAEEGVNNINGAIQQMDMIGSSMNKSLKDIALLHDRSQEIEKIVEVITALSSQTNLLALNASIEAARAGEQGKGFAVVANEVNKLAEQSSQSAKQIAALIHEIQDYTGQSVGSMARVQKDVELGFTKIHAAGSAFKNIANAAKSLSEEIQELSATTEEMSATAEQMSASINSMSNNIKFLTHQYRTVEQSANEQNIFIDNMRKTSQTLQNMASKMNKLIGMFIIKEPDEEQQYM